MSRTSFKILSSLPRLESIDLLNIQDSWVVEEDFASSLGFPHLKELIRCSMSGLALQILQPSFGKIETFRLNENGDLASLWTIMAKARFAHLSSLTLNLHFDTILHADEILSIAYHHPQLHTFQVVTNYPGIDYYPLIANSYNDAKVTALAKSLPQLKQLTLGCCDETQRPIGEDSLFALGHHCPMLETCFVYATVDWRKLLSEDFSDIAWPRLNQLFVVSRCVVAGQMGRAREAMDVSTLGTFMLPRMPSMRDASAAFYDQGQAVFDPSRDVMPY